jgi:hypothetical protein
VLSLGISYGLPAACGPTKVRYTALLFLALAETYKWMLTLPFTRNDKGVWILRYLVFYLSSLTMIPTLPTSRMMLKSVRMTRAVVAVAVARGGR